MYILTDEGPFVSELDEESLRKAVDELNEDIANRDGAVQTLRDWVRQQTWMHAPTGTRFLMQYLRSSKFSQLEARRKLENSLQIRTENSEWCQGCKTTDVNIQEIFKTGFLLRLPKPEAEGRVLVLNRPGLLPIEQIKTGALGGLANVFRAMICFLDWLMMDERVQVHGMVVIIDYTDFAFAKRSTLFTPTNVRKLMAFIQNGCCIRLKALHALYPDPLFEAGMSLARPFLKQKIKDRIITHGNSLVSFYKQVDMSVLPKEFLPDDYKGEHCGTLDEILKFNLDGLTSQPVFDYIKSLSTDYKVDLTKKPTDEQENASYRKLNVDLTS